MINSTTKIFAAVLSVGFLFGGIGAVSAQDKKDDKNKAATITVSKDEEKAIKKIESAKTLDEKWQLIVDFNKKYPQSPARKQIVGYAAGQISELKDDSQIVQKGENFLTIFTQPEDADLVLPNLIYSYVQLKKSKEAFDAGQKYLARHPEDVTTRLRLTIDGSNQLRAGNKEFTTQTREIGMQTIALIEADKRPADLNETQWAEYKTKWLPQIYQSVGSVELAAGDKAKAKTNLDKAVALDPKDVNSLIMLATMLDEDYQELANKFNAAPVGAERDAMLNRANEKMDAAIEAFARIVAVTDDKPEAKNLNEQVRSNLENYYKYRHKNTDGLQAMIDKYKK